MLPAEKMPSIHVTAALDEKLDRLVEATGRAKNVLTLNALKTHLADQGWQVKDIREAIEEADHGEFASAREVAGFKRKWIDG